MSCKHVWTIRYIKEPVKCFGFTMYNKVWEYRECTICPTIMVPYGFPDKILKLINKQLQLRSEVRA